MLVLSMDSYHRLLVSHMFVLNGLWMLYPLTPPSLAQRGARKGHQWTLKRQQGAQPIDACHDPSERRHG